MNYARSANYSEANYARRANYYELRRSQITAEGQITPEGQITAEGQITPEGQITAEGQITPKATYYELRPKGKAQMTLRMKQCHLRLKQ